MRAKLLLAALAAAAVAVTLDAPMASAQTAQPRSAQNIRRDAQWAAQHAVTELKANGIQGLIDDIRKCYDTTALPAFRCVCLDMAGWSIDTSMGKSLGLNGPTKEYFASPAMGERLMPQMTAQGLTQAQAKAQVAESLSMMGSAVDAEWSAQKLAESGPPKQPVARKLSVGDCTSVADCGK